MLNRIRYLLATALGVITLTGCASKPPLDQVDLMPAPDVYGYGLLNPLPESSPFDQIP